MRGAAHDPAGERDAGSDAADEARYASAPVGTAAYVLGFAASFWLPEPSREELPD